MIICNKSNYLKRELNKINHKHTLRDRQADAFRYSADLQ